MNVIISSMSLDIEPRPGKKMSQIIAERQALLEKQRSVKEAKTRLMEREANVPAEVKTYDHNNLLPDQRSEILNYKMDMPTQDKSRHFDSEPE